MKKETTEREEFIRVGTTLYKLVNQPRLNGGYVRKRIVWNNETLRQDFDKEHPHVHIAYNRIDNNGNTISDRNERLRSSRICKELTMKYGLYMADSKDNVKRERLKEPDRTKYEL